MAFLTSVSFPLRQARPQSAPICRRTRTITAVTPLFDRVLIRPDEADTESASGLILTSSPEEKATTGTVVAVGAGRYSTEGVKEPMDFQPGDRVLWKDSYGSENISENGEDLIALRIFSIVAKV